jgi:hypothetical protein
MTAEHRSEESGGGDSRTRDFSGQPAKLHGDGRVCMAMDAFDQIAEGRTPVPERRAA